MGHQIESGRIFRQAWIAGVTKHFPGTPKPGYVSPWENMAEWEQNSAIAVFDQIRQFVLATDGATAKLTRQQRGRIVCLCWIGQIFKHIPNPKESYIADWEQLPEWQRETDADIFESIETAVLKEEARI